MSLNWSLEDLAAKSGLSPRYLSSVERELRDPSLSTIEAVSRALGVEPAELFGSKALPSASIEAARLFTALSEDAQQTIVSLMRMLKRKR